MNQIQPNGAPATESDDGTPPSTSPKSRPYRCQQCSVSFKRVDHLKRHVKLHTGEMQYQCPCGSEFCRNDVLARHVRRCSKAQSDQVSLPKLSAKQTRSKSACNRCAQFKLRCDSKDPCFNCQNRSVACKYTREGYSDPYNMYRINRRNKGPTTPENGPRASDGDDAPSAPDDAQVQTPAAATPPPPPPQAYHFAAPENAWGGTSAPTTILPQMQSDATDPASSAVNPSAMEAYDFTDQDANMMLDMPADLDFLSLFDFPFDQGSLLFQPDPTSCVDDPQSVVWPLSRSDNADPQAATLTDPLRMGGFSLHQIDPVEAKCLEIRNLLQGAEPLVSADDISRHITCQNLVRGIELYGQHFQPNVPILHIPTFDLTKTSPILLLAMMLVGACYSESLIPAPHVTKLAVQLLMLIEQQPHERNMQAPPLATIQAGIILRPVLCCSRNTKAFKFSSVHFARNISMAERAGLFDCIDPIDYSVLTDKLFDWNLWIEQETRRRVACQIFCQDMGLCVFRRRSSSFSPRTFGVQLPSYESCWEAETATECLQQLQCLPQQIRVSTAIQYMGSEYSDTAPAFEASAFGMFVLIMGLHCVLFQATQNNLEASSDMATTIQPTPDADPMSTLRQALSGKFLPALADVLVAQHGSSSTLKHINHILEKWHVIWNRRGSHEFKQENRTFSGDPVKFWWLAKLYIVLHFYRHVIAKDSEYATPEGVDEQTNVSTQLKVIGWLRQFQPQKNDAQLSPTCYLAQFIKAADGR